MGRNSQPKGGNPTAKTRRTTKKTGFGQALEQARLEKGVRLSELSVALNVSIPFLSDVENGRRQLSDDRIRKAAEFLGADPEPMLELATQDRGKIVLDTSNLSTTQIRAAMQFVAVLPTLTADKAEHLLSSFRAAS